MAAVAVDVRHGAAAAWARGVREYGLCRRGHRGVETARVRALLRSLCVAAQHPLRSLRRVLLLRRRMSQEALGRARDSVSISRTLLEPQKGGQGSHGGAPAAAARAGRRARIACPRAPFVHCWCRCCLVRCWCRCCFVRCWCRCCFVRVSHLRLRSAAASSAGL